MKFMKDIRKFTLIVASTMCLSTFAMDFGQYGPLFYFGTMGDDRYADESLALNGECYALVWQRDGVPFEGFNATGTVGYEENTTLPVDPVNCRVVAVWPVAINEEIEGVETTYCPEVFTRVDRAFYVAHGQQGGGTDLGTFSVYLFDTRIWTGDDVSVGGYDQTSKTIPVLNAYSVVSFLDVIDMVEGSDKWNPDLIDKKGLIPEVAFPVYGDVDEDWENYEDTFADVETVVPADAPQPCVREFVRGDGVVMLSVTNTASYLRYNVTGADELGELQSTTNLVGTAQQGGGKLTWTIPAPGAKGFYKVIRQPLVEPGR